LSFLPGGFICQRRHADQIKQSRSTFNGAVIYPTFPPVAFSGSDTTPLSAVVRPTTKRLLALGLARV
jgi:hypothetical protein